MSDDTTPEQMCQRTELFARSIAGFAGASIQSREPLVIQVSFSSISSAHEYVLALETAGRPANTFSMAPGDETTVLLRWVRSGSSVSHTPGLIATPQTAAVGNRCLGPTHRAGSETFTVIISQNEVKRGYRMKTFHGCEVTAPRRWKCLDESGGPAIMYDDVLVWDERKDLDSVTKSSYCFADALKGMKSDTLDRIACYLGDP